MRVPAERSLRRSRTSTPSLLVIGQLGTTFAGGLFLLLFVVALFGRGTFSINNEPVSSSEFLRRAGAAWLIITASMLAIAYGLWRERSWARPLMVAWWANGIVIPIFLSLHGEWPIADAVWSGAQCLIASVLAYLYLYRKDNVVAYFEALEAPKD